MKALSDNQIRSLVDEFYTDSQEDIVGLFAIAQAVEDILGQDPDSVREQTLRVVEALLDRGMLAGNSPYHPHGYQPWADQDRNALLKRIRSEWLRLGHSLSIPDIAWFGPSEEGATSRTSTR
ncbi:MAG: hypothetical protein RQ966_18850 [Acetobacteraceae bacterium]|nr:hypothetical protein [Acetobacteraceae bacterium]